MSKTNKTQMSKAQSQSKALKAAQQFLFRKQKSILSAAFLIMGLSLASRILGLVRDRLLAAYFGSGPDLAAYLAAFRLPDFIFQVLIFGTITVSFIPIFTDLSQKQEAKKLWSTVSNIINIAFLFFVAISLVCFIFVEPLVALIAPGLVADPAQHATLVNLTRVMIISQIFLAVSSFFTGILQSSQRFLIPALAPVFYNLGIILGAVLLSNNLGIYGPAIGVVLGAIMHFLIQVPAIYASGFNYQFVLNFKEPSLVKLLRLGLPRSVGMFASQINETVDIALASIISAKSVVAFNFASHLYVVPIGLFGATIAQAALPALSLEYAKNNIEAFKKTILTSMHQMLFLVVPAAICLIVLRIPLVRLIFGASEFDWPATVLTGRTLATLSFGIAAQSVLLLIVRAFYAFHDTVTPLKIGLISVGTNIVLSLIFVKILTLPVWALGLSGSISAIINLTLLIIFLDRKVGKFSRRELLLPAFKIFTAGFFMALSLYIPIKLLDQLIFDTTKTVNLIILTGISTTAGFTVYLFLTHILRVEEIRLFWSLARKIRSTIRKETPQTGVVTTLIDDDTPGSTDQKIS